MNVAGYLLGGGLLLFAALPATDNYKLHDYGFGAGGGTIGSDNYSLEGLAGDLSGENSVSDNYGLKPGLLGSRLANLPDAPSWQNPDDWYNKLQLIIETSDNPGDTTYAVAISSDNFVTTNYVQSDDTVGVSLGSEDFRDFSGWGAGSGMNVIGLSPDTTYQVKVKARHGESSETGFGPSASAATSQASIVFDIDVDDIDNETASPYLLEFGNITPDTIEDSPDFIWLDLSSNAESGSFVYVVSDNEGLSSAVSGHTIEAANGDLNLQDEGIGAQNSSTVESSGGPLSAISPFNGGSDVVGAIDGQFKQLLASSGPLAGGRAAFLLKLKTSVTTPAAPDYTDIYTFIAAAAF